MPGITSKRIEALVKLLGDPDQQTAKIAHHELLELGQSAVPRLLTASEAPELVLRKRARQLLMELDVPPLEEYFIDYASQDDQQLDLETGAFLVARIGYRGLNISHYRQLLDELAANCPVQDPEPGFRELAVLGDYLFDYLGFDGNRSNYYETENNFLSSIIDRRCGNPVGLSILHMLVAKRLGLELQGVGLPGHFITLYQSEAGQVFMDPFNGGRFLSKSDIASYLTRTGYEFDEVYLRPVRVRRIVSRLLTNLIYQAKMDARNEDEQELAALLRILLYHEYGED